MRRGVAAEWKVPARLVGLAEMMAFQERSTLFSLSLKVAAAILTAALLDLLMLTLMPSYSLFSRRVHFLDL